MNDTHVANKKDLFLDSFSQQQVIFIQLLQQYLSLLFNVHNDNKSGEYLVCRAYQLNLTIIHIGNHYDVVIKIAIAVILLHH